MSTIMVVDDEPLIRTSLQGVLESDGHVVLLARSGLEAVDLATEHAPELAIVDLRLPDIDGTELTRRLRRWSQAPILILSGVGAEARKVSALDSGADDYLQKPFGVDELKARVRALARRTTETRPVVLAFVDLTIDLAAGTVTGAQDREIRLTPLEWQLLERLATNQGKLMTHRRLAAEVWGETYGDEMRQTLRTHLHSLRAKLGDSASQPRYIRTESGAGYRWVAAPVHRQARVPAQADGPRAERGGAEAGPPDDDTLHELMNALTVLTFGLDRMAQAAGEVVDPLVQESLAEGVRRCRRASDRALLLASVLEESAMHAGPVAVTP